MRALIPVIGLVLLGACVADADDEMPQQAELYSVLYYADWCPSCKVLDPALDRAKNSADLNNAPVLFVRLDLTNKKTKAQAALLANALGIGEHLAANDGKTGYAVLIDPETKAAKGTLNKSMSDEAIAMAIKAGIAF
ncbi:MAG: thioredoxin domain-containing protein [Pseudomonadota bacterium]